MSFITLTMRNIKIFFKDKGMFFTSLITPIILLVLYSTFLGKVYTDSFTSALPEGFTASDEVVSAVVSGQLLSSLLAVCCVTTAFCANMLMVQDKVSGTRTDLTASPVKSGLLAASYYVSSAVSTLIVSFAAMCACLIYVYSTGWFMSGEDIAFLAADIVLMVLFGTALSSIVNIFISTQGQISAVGTIVSAGYGFICGAYMPISQFGDGLKKILYFLPGTYGTALIKNHAMRGAFEKMRENNLPDELVNEYMRIVDCKPSFFDREVTASSMYIYLSVSVAVLIAVYILLSVIKERKSV